METNLYSKCKPEIVLINKEINLINENDINYQSEISINIFSNILDVQDNKSKTNVVDLDILNSKIQKLKKNSLFVCISPNYHIARKNIDYFIDGFKNMFNELYFNDQMFKVESYDFKSKKMRKRRHYQYAKAFFVE